MQVCAKTNIGNFREINQDRVAYEMVDGNNIFAVVCDGMGGHKAGEVASMMAVEYMTSHFNEHPVFENDNDVRVWMTLLVENANKAIEKESIVHEEYAGMGTTIVMAYITDTKVYISHVGDSRAYLHYNNELKQITVDDTLVNALLENGYLTPREAEFYPQKNVLVQAVGVTSPLKISFYVVEQSWDTLLLCSDGLYNSITNEQMNTILKDKINCEEKTDKLIQEAITNGGYDNIGVVLVVKETES